MFNVFYYMDKNGKKPIEEYLNELSAKTDKDSRIFYEKNAKNPTTRNKAS